MAGYLKFNLYPTRGLRQGDPISPYIFIMCLNELSHDLHHAETDARILPINLGQKGFPLSHLFFADDSIIFSGAMHTAITHLTSVLQKFLTEASLTINIQKSHFLISSNATRRTKEEMRSLLNMIVVSNLGKYLGLPLMNTRPNKLHFQPVVDKMSATLTTWISKYLSLAGRMVMVKSVISSLLGYYL